MKYIRFSIDGMEKNGVLVDEKIRELEEDFLVNKKDETGTEFMLTDVKVLPPVKAGKVVLIGLNYVKHAAEVNKPIPEEPMMFMVSPSAIIAHNDLINIPFLDHETHYEAELAVVIGKEAKGVKKENALEYVFGYTIANDVSDRNLQRKDGQFTRAKSFDTFKPLGPIIQTDINPNNLEIRLTVNGETRQHSNTSDLIFSIEELMEEVTSVMTLDPGDIILTGTPSGVGPLKPGDQIEITIESIGTLKNKVSSQA